MTLVPLGSFYVLLASFGFKTFVSDILVPLRGSRLSGLYLSCRVPRWQQFRPAKRNQQVQQAQQAQRLTRNRWRKKLESIWRIWKHMCRSKAARSWKKLPKCTGTRTHVPSLMRPQDATSTSLVVALERPNLASLGLEYLCTSNSSGRWVLCFCFVPSWLGPTPPLTSWATWWMRTAPSTSTWGWLRLETWELVKVVGAQQMKRYSRAVPGTSSHAKCLWGTWRNGLVWQMVSEFSSCSLGASCFNVATFPELCERMTMPILLLQILLLTLLFCPTNWPMVMNNMNRNWNSTSSRSSKALALKTLLQLRRCAWWGTTTVPSALF